MPNVNSEEAQKGPARQEVVDRTEETRVAAAAAKLEHRQRITGSDGRHYRVLEPLGGGGNSVVYLVEAISGSNRGVLFALKVFFQVADPTRRERFDNEIRFLRSCDHPSIMRAYDSGEYYVNESLKLPFVVTEYLPETLRAAMLGRLTVVEKTVFTLQLLAGLAYLSSKEPAITHRDIKPENIFVKGRSAVLGDFGLLKAGDGIDPSVEYHVQASSGIRFPRLYPTPDLVEYCKNRANPTPLTPKSDVFQLGLVIAEMFTGELPIRLRQKPFDPVELTEVPAIDGSQGVAIRSYILQMLETNAEKRPAAVELFDHWEGSFLWLIDATRQLGDKVFSR